MKMRPNGLTLGAVVLSAPLLAAPAPPPSSSRILEEIPAAQSASYDFKVDGGNHYEVVLTVVKGSATMWIAGAGVSNIDCEVVNEEMACTYLARTTESVTVTVTAGSQGAAFPPLSHNKIYAHVVNARSSPGAGALNGTYARGHRTRHRGSSAGTFKLCRATPADTHADRVGVGIQPGTCSTSC